MSGGVIVNSFWDIQTSGLAISAGGTGKTTAEMMNLATYTMMGTPGLTTPWDFVGDPHDDTGTNDYWGMQSWMVGGYPNLVDNYCMIRQLPVDFLFLNTQCEDNGNSVKLMWQTASELNSDKYIVYRSYDYKNWEDIGSIPAAGNSNTVRSYEFIDRTADTDVTIYYRLKQLDFDGKFQFYGPAISNCSTTMSHNAKLFPCPTDSDFNIQIETKEADDCHIRVHSFNGTLIHSFMKYIHEGSTVISVEHLQLPSGIYLVSIQTTKNSTTLRLVIN
jgi:hypothetical protein